VTFSTIKGAWANIPRLKTGKRVLITGASGGIGCETLRLFAQSDVLIGAHHFTNGDSLSRLIEERSLEASRIQIFQSDLTTSRSSQDLINAFVAWAGGIDVLVQLSGGICHPTPWDELTEAEWRADIDLNLTAPFFLAQTAMKHMRATGGKIILTSTASARHGGGRTSMAYGIAKAGVECLTKGLAHEGAPFKILVNAICPGFINTTFHTKRMYRTSEDLQQRAELVPLKRAGTPSEVAGMIVFLASSWGDFITGECISISGGDWL